MNVQRRFILFILTLLFCVTSFCFNSKIVYDDHRQYIINADNQLFFKGMNETDWQIFEPLAHLKISAISSGGVHDLERHYLALDLEGHVWAWGLNNNGQLGLSDTVVRQAPTMIPELSNIVGIKSVHERSLVWDHEGNLWGFGKRSCYILQGIEGNVYQPTPTKIPGLPPIPIKDVAIGGFHVLALGMDGIVWVWGNNKGGQIGYGEVERINTPTPLEGIPPIIQLSLSSYTSFLLDENNHIWTMGREYLHPDCPCKDRSIANFGKTPRLFYDLKAKEIANGGCQLAAIDTDNTLVIWGLVGARNVNWEFIENPRRVEDITGHSVFIFKNEIYVLTLKNTLIKYRHFIKDDLETSSTILCGNPIPRVKSSRF